MSEIILKAENISKQYRLGLVGTGTISHDLNRWWSKVRGKEDPFLKVGETNDRSTKGESDYVWALRDINFEVKRGEVLGIIGKNGAGKSTLLKILSRVTSPTTGEIKTKGRIASLLEVGTGFHPEMTGRENIYLNGAILGMTKAEIRSKMDEIIDFSGCQRYIDTPVKRYSSGMTVRLAFAVAAHLEPDILVVDEVLAVGDAEFQKKAIGKMQDISKGDGRTVLFVSHDMTAIQYLCKKCIVLEKGILVNNCETDLAISYYLKKASNIKDLSQIKERSGNGKVKVKEILIYGISKEFKPQSATPFVIKVLLDNPFKYSSKEIRIDLKIDDFKGRRVLWLSNYVIEHKTISNVKFLIFSIPKLMLNSGTYYLSSDLYVDNSRSDWLQNAVKFDVMEGDFYRSGKRVPIEESSFLLDFELHMKS